MSAIAKIADAYDAPTWWYDVRGFFVLTFAYRSSLSSQLRLFGRNVSSQHLEVAVGSGTLLDLILRKRRWEKAPVGRIVAFDCAPSMLAGAVRRFAGDSSIELALEDVGRLPYAKNSFSSANIANSVHCFPDVDAALAEVTRVLCPGGTLAMNALLEPRGGSVARTIAQKINAWGARKGIVVGPLDDKELCERIERAGLHVEHTRVSGNTLELIARKPSASSNDAEVSSC